MKTWIAFWNIIKKDIKAYYLKPPNISWGILFPFAWTFMFIIKSGQGMMELYDLLPGLIGISILFGSTSMLAVTVTFEKKSGSFERLLLAPLPLHMLMLSKTMAAIIFGSLNALIPLFAFKFLFPAKEILWLIIVSAIILISISCSFLGLFVAISVKEVFEAQTLSNFFRFPMIFLCGLFFPIEKLPYFVKFVAFVQPLTYGVDMLKYGLNANSSIPLFLDISLLLSYCMFLYLINLNGIKTKWVS